MYALSVRQPFASQIILGEKTIEWRSRPFNYRGTLVICASKTEKVKLVNGKMLPIGVALGLVDVVGCRLFTREDLVPACCEDYDIQEYGEPEGYAWILENPREVLPVPIKGIVAPWPWKGPELELAPGWHEEHIFCGIPL